MRKTKIICTIGPASDSEAVLTKMCLEGMNVARLNFSHGTHSDHKAKIDLIKSVREKLGLPIAIMLDTKGPEYRIKTFENGKITLSDGDKFTFTTDDVIGNEKIVSVSYSHLIEELSVGDRILLNNGLVIFEVTEIDGSCAHCTVIAGGELSHRVEMEYRYYNSNIYTAACEVVGAPCALLYINDIGAHRGYAHSEVGRISDTTYKRQKSAVFGNIARRLHLV